MFREDAPPGGQSALFSFSDGAEMASYEKPV